MISFVGESAFEHWEMIAGMSIAFVCVAGMLISALLTRRARQEKDAKAMVLRAAIMSAHIGVTITCEGGPITKVNPAFCKMLGYTPEEIFEKGWDGLSHPDDHRDAGAAVSALRAEGGESTTAFFCRYLRKDGRYFPAYVNVSLVPGAGRDGTNLQLAQIQDVNEFRLVWKRTPEKKRSAIDVVARVA